MSQYSSLDMQDSDDDEDDDIEARNTSSEQPILDDADEQQQDEEQQSSLPQTAWRNLASLRIPFLYTDSQTDGDRDR